MNESSNYIEEERISLAYLIRSLTEWFRFILSKWLIISLGTLTILSLILAYNYLKPKVYFSKTSFVLENASEGLGEISSLASLAGVSLGGLTDNGSPLFQIDNIQALYRSHRMLEQTLLSFGEKEEKDVQIIDLFAETQRLKSSWMKKGISIDQFRLERQEFTRAQDSVLIASIELIRENLLHVEKPNRKTTILEVGFKSKDELLAKLFNEVHVKNVNQFYTDTRIKKASDNLRILTVQADSIKNVLDQSIELLAQLDQNVPNPNPLFKTSQVPYQKALIQVQANGAIYQEIVKQLELARISQRNNMPLIQVIDVPLFPLEHNRWKLFKTLVVGGFIGVVFMILLFTVQRVIKLAMAEEDERIPSQKIEQYS